MASVLSERLRGEVHGRGDSRAPSELSGFNPLVAHDPDLVVVPVSAADVVETVRFAGEQGLRIHVLGTGHGTLAPIRSGLVLSVRRLTSVEVDPARRVVKMGGGTRWGAVIAEAGRFGLAPVAGASGTVGTVGLLLGGGLGPLARSHGFASDRWNRATIVDGSGQCIEASHEGTPDLLWALRVAARHRASSRSSRLDWWISRCCTPGRSSLPRTTSPGYSAAGSSGRGLRIRG